MGHDSIGGGQNLDLFEGHDEFRELVEQLNDGRPIEDRAAAIDTLVEGIQSDSQLGSYVLDALINAHDGDLLESVFDTGAADDLGFETQETLLLIVEETDVDTQVRALGELVIYEFDPSADRPSISYQSAQGRTVPMTPTPGGSGDGPDGTLDYLLDRAEKGDAATLAREFSEEPDLWDVVRDAGHDGLPILTELANDPTHGPTAIEMIHGLGDSAMPALTEAAVDNPGASAALYWLTEGEPMAPEALAEQQAGYWVDHLNDPDPATRFHARQSLRGMGDPAISSLMDARSDPELRPIAENLLQEMIEGEDFLTDEPDNSWPSFGDDPEGNLSELGRQTPTGSSSELYLDSDQIRLSLGDPATRMSALNALVEIGRPAVPVLCELLWRR